MVPSMSLAGDSPGPILEEPEVMADRLDLHGLDVLELGCGRGLLTCSLAQRFQPGSWLATDLDPELMARNQLMEGLPDCVRFQPGRAQEIELPDASVDVVLLFKSLHHVPREEMPTVLVEIHRVLRPGGRIWLSEPVFAGNFNEILRIFHDEEEARRAAFEAVEKVVSEGLFELEEEFFFRAPRHFRDWQDLQEGFLNMARSWVTIPDHQLAQVQSTFEGFCGPEGAFFAQPQRVDVLRRAEA